MKPVVNPGLAWCCTVLSVFAIVILSVVASLFASGHESMVGAVDDPKDGKAVASTIYTSVVVYLIFLVFCGSQAYLHTRERRGVQLQ